MTKTAAIFDIDGTLVPCNSCERIFIAFLLERKVLHFWPDTLNFFLKFCASGKFLTNKYYLQGRNQAEITLLAEECFKERILPNIPKMAGELIAKHKRNGDLTFILSGTSEHLAKAFVKHFGFDGYKATVFEIKDGLFTGKIVGLFPFGPKKAIVLKELAREYDLDLSQCTAYADNIRDRSFLQAVGHPVAINPDLWLKEYVANHGWDIIEKME